jgi:hypothetical protein
MTVFRIEAADVVTRVYLNPYLKFSSTYCCHRGSFVAEQASLDPALHGGDEAALNSPEYISEGSLFSYGPDRCGDTGGLIILEPRVL